MAPWGEWTQVDATPHHDFIDGGAYDASRAMQHVQELVVELLRGMIEYTSQIFIERAQWCIVESQALLKLVTCVVCEV